MKYLFVLIFLLLPFAPHAFAQGFVPLAPIPGLTAQTTSVGSMDALSGFFNNLYKYLVGLGAAIAVVQIVWAGISIAMNRDSVSTVLAEKGKIRNAVLGLILVLSPALVFGIINPSILNLSLNLGPIQSAPTGGSAYDLLNAPANNTFLNTNTNNPRLSYSADAKDYSGTPPAGAGWCFSFTSPVYVGTYYKCSGDLSSCQGNWTNMTTNETSNHLTSSCSQF